MKDLGPTVPPTTNSPPTITTIWVANSEGDAVDNDDTTNNHICKSEFTTSTYPKKVEFWVAVSDPDGVGDSGTAPVVNWHGYNYQTSWTGISGGYNIAEVTVDYSAYSGTAPQGLYDMTATYRDRSGLAAVNSGGDPTIGKRRWKVWDCQVPVSGTMYDSSGTVADCVNGTGFNNPATVAMNFTSVDAKYIPSGTHQTANAVNFNTYSGIGVTWDGNYLFSTNGDIDAPGIIYRWIDFGDGVGASTSACGQENVAMVDPYQNNPAMKVDMAGVANQGPWWQAAGGGVAAVPAVDNNAGCAMGSGI